MIGDDDRGRAIRVHHAAEGVETRYDVHPSGTRRSVNLVDPSGRREFLWDGRHPAGYRPPDDLWRPFLERTRHVHVSIIDWTLAVFDEIEARGPPSSTDPRSLHPAARRAAVTRDIARRPAPPARSLEKRFAAKTVALFRDADALALTEDELRELITAREREWTNVEPAIFGTPLENALDPNERGRLGAHFPPRAHVERLVGPTILEPPREEWRMVRVAAEAARLKSGDAEAIREIKAFHEHLCAVRVLDPLGPRPADWPEADHIIGNPPFIGGKDPRAELGDGYAEALWKTHPDIPGDADFVMYWWDKAAEAVRTGKAKRFGFITTNSLTRTFSRRVAAEPPLRLVFAAPDHPWAEGGGPRRRDRRRPRFG